DTALRPGGTRPRTAPGLRVQGTEPGSESRPVGAPAGRWRRSAADERAPPLSRPFPVRSDLSARSHGRHGHAPEVERSRAPQPDAAAGPRRTPHRRDTRTVPVRIPGPTDGSPGQPVPAARALAQRIPAQP